MNTPKRFGLARPTAATPTSVTVPRSTPDRIKLQQATRVLNFDSQPLVLDVEPPTASSGPRTVSNSPLGCQQCDQKIMLVHDFLAQHAQVCPLITNIRSSTASAVGVSKSTVGLALKRQKRRHDGTFVEPELGGKNKLVLTDAQREKIRFAAHDVWKGSGYVTLDILLAKLQVMLLEAVDDAPPSMSREKLRQVLHELGFKVLKVSLKETMLFEREDLVVWRKSYFQKLAEHEAAGRVMIFIDETWFNFNDAPEKAWHDPRLLDDPTLHLKDERYSRGPKKAAKGGRLIILSAVSKQIGVIPGTTRIFDGRKTGDYHESMNSEAWLQYLRENILENEHVPHDAILVIDNAPYHCAKIVTELVPLKAMKAEKVEWCKAHGIATEGRTVPELNRSMKVYRTDHPELQDRYAMDKLLTDYFEAHGKRVGVLRLPPYHATLNPIEGVWSETKKIGLKANCEHEKTPRALSVALVEAALKSVTHEMVCAQFDRVASVAERYKKLDAELDAHIAQMRAEKRMVELQSFKRAVCLAPGQLEDSESEGKLIVLVELEEDSESDQLGDWSCYLLMLICFQTK